jgi:hypothetical protein
MFASAPAVAKPALARGPTRRQFVEGLLDEAERLARDRKMPYLDMVVGLRRELGTDGVIGLIAKRFGPAYREGAECFRDYCSLEVQRQTQVAIQAGASDLIGWRYTQEDAEWIVASLGRICAALQ